MNVKALVPLVAGLGIGGVALKLGMSTLQQARAGQRTVAKVAVWAPKEDLPRGVEIREEMLQEMAFPTDLVPNGAFKEKDKEKLVGRIPRTEAPAGLPVLESMLAPAGTTPGINPKAGFRAVAVNIDAGSGVDYHLEPGAFVDVVGSFRIKNETVAKTIVENAEIAAVGPRLSPATGKAEDKEKDRSPQQVRAVTLFVKPDQVKKILLAEQQGKIKLSLRGADDTAEQKNDAFVSDRELLGLPAEEKEATGKSGPVSNWLRDLLKRSAKPAPVLAAAPPQKVDEPWRVRIYRGPAEEQVQFKSRNSSERLNGTGSSDPGLFGNTRRSPAGATPPAAERKPEPQKTEPTPEPEPEPVTEPQEPHE